MALSGATAADKLATKNHEKTTMFKWPTEAQLHASIHASDNKSRKTETATKTTTTNRNRNQSYHQGYAVKPRRILILIINNINTNADTDYLNADTDYLNLILSIHI